MVLTFVRNLGTRRLRHEVCMGADKVRWPMELRVSITLTDEEKRQLAGILSCTEADLETVLQPYGRAAVQEYLRMFLGQKVFTRGMDLQEYRLFLLIKEAFGNQVPEEQRICDLFQTTATQSRSLLRSVMSKYQYELHDAINASCRQLIANATYDKDLDEWVVTINSDNMVEALNRAIGAMDGALPQVAKKRGSVCSYVLKPSSYERLCQHFGVTPNYTTP